MRRPAVRIEPPEGMRPRLRDVPRLAWVYANAYASTASAAQSDTGTYSRWGAKELVLWVPQCVLGGVGAATGALVGGLATNEDRSAVIGWSRVRRATSSKALAAVAVAMCLVAGGLFWSAGGPFAAVGAVAVAIGVMWSLGVHRHLWGPIRMMRREAESLTGTVFEVGSFAAWPLGGGRGPDLASAMVEHIRTLNLDNVTLVAVPRTDDLRAMYEGWGFTTGGAPDSLLLRLSLPPATQAPVNRDQRTGQNP